MCAKIYCEGGIVMEIRRDYYLEKLINAQFKKNVAIRSLNFY